MANYLNKLVYVKKKASFTSDLQETYKNSIVFIEDEGLIWTHDREFGLSATDLTALKGRVTTLESARWFNGIAEVGESKSIFKAADGATTIKFAGDDNITTVTVSADGVKVSVIPVSLTGDTYIAASATKNVGTVKANVTKMSAITGTTTGEGTLADAADVKTYVDGKVAAESGKTDKIITAVGLNSDGTHKTVTGSNYTGSATTIAEEISALDTNLKTTNDNLGTKTDAASVDTAFGRIKKNADGLAALEGKLTGSKTIELKNTVFETALTLKYVAAAGGTPAHLALTDKEGTELSTIPASDIIGNGSIKDSSYNKTTGVLTLTFNSASGTDVTHEIDLGEMLDINDVLVDTDSAKYLEVDLTGAENSQAKFKVLLGNVASGTDGLADAKSVKAYADGLISGLVVAATEKTGTNVKIGYSETAGKVSIDSITETYATVTGGDSVTVTTPTGLVKGSDIQTVVSYVDGKLDEIDVTEEIEAAIGELDADIDSTGGTNVGVKVTQTDGKVSAVTVTTTYATVGSDLTITTPTGLVTGNDLKKVIDLNEWIEIG